jgi:hypothetical protein
MVTAERAKALLALHGEVRSQPPGDWKGSFPIPPPIERFYREIGPADITIKVHGNPFFLPCLAGLWQFQAGYRWNGLSGEPIEDWNNDWIVIADEGGDPFILSRLTGAVLHAYHGEGKWYAQELFPDPNTMAACLAQLGLIALEAADKFMTEDWTIRVEFRTLASVRLRDLLGSSSAAQQG